MVKSHTFQTIGRNTRKHPLNYLNLLEIVEWKLSAWEIPADVCCMIRATNLKTKKVKEHIYKRQHAAEAKVVEYMTKQTHEFVVCSHDTIHYVHPDLFDDDEQGDI